MGQSELLAEGVEGSGAVRPILVLTLGCVEVAVGRLLLLLLDGLCDFLGPVLLHTVII